MLLERLSRGWGINHDDGTLCVWFSLRTPGTTAIGPEVSDDDLFEMMDRDPATASDELVRRHRDLAEMIARRYRGKGIDDDDLIQVANMALLKSIQRYDSSLGALRAYAAATISGELKRMLRDRGWSVRVPRSLQEMSLAVGRIADQMTQALNRSPEPDEIAEYMDLTEDEVRKALEARQAYQSSSMDTPSDETGRSILDRLEEEDIRLLLADDRVVVETAMQRLPERQQRILRLRFNDDLTQSEIADQVGISQMHVSRLLQRALATLRNTIGDEAETP
jgi:RNA polymerase sigma-B factor